MREERTRNFLYPEEGRSIEAKEVNEKIQKFAKSWKDLFGGERGKQLWRLAKEKPKVPTMTRREYNLIKSDLRKLENRKIATSQRSDLLGGKGMPTGIYQLMLVFDGGTQGAEDRERPFIIWTSSNKRGL